MAYAITVGLILNQQLRDRYDNNYLKEIASNGPYQFFAAFRNNALDYETFYINGDEAAVSAEIRQILKQKNSKFTSDEIFDITRQIDNLGEEKRLNVILVSVES